MPAIRLVGLPLEKLPLAKEDQVVLGRCFSLPAHMSLPATAQVQVKDQFGHDQAPVTQQLREQRALAAAAGGSSLGLSINKRRALVGKGSRPTWSRNRVTAASAISSAAAWCSAEPTLPQVAGSGIPKQTVPVFRPEDALHRRVDARQGISPCARR